MTWRKLRDNFLKSWVGGARSLSRELEKAEGNRGGGNSGNGGIPFIAAGAEERKRRGEREGERREGRGEAMECSAGAAIEQRGRWCRTPGVTPAIIAFCRQGGVGAVDWWLRFGGKRASSCGRGDRSDRLNGARIEGAQVRRQADAGAGESAEQQIVGRLLTERGKELSRLRSGLAVEESSCSGDRAAQLWLKGRKRRATSGSGAGIWRRDDGRGRRGSAERGAEGLPLPLGKRAREPTWSLARDKIERRASEKTSHAAGRL